jgi:hypothetical protein
MDNNNNNNNIGNAGAGPISSGPVHQAPQTNKSGIKTVLIFVLIIALLAGSSFGAFLYGKQTANKANDKKNAEAAAPKRIDLPKETIVLNECVVGRGKQYIETKNIPVGPIYDVRNSEVIAIEYSLGVNGLLKNPEQFSQTLLALTTDNPVDHFDIVLQRPKAGDTDQMISLIMFVVSTDEANKITCGTTAATTTTTTPASTTTPAATQ